MRLRLALGLTVVLGLAVGLKYKLLLGLVGPETLWTLIGIDAAALLLLLVYSIAALTAHLTALREMLNSLDIYIDGRHEHRLPVQGSGLLTDLSRRINDVLAHDAEGEEMNSATPGIKRVVRPAEVTDPQRRAALLSSPQVASDAPVSIAPGEGVGPVRVRRRDSQDQIERFDTEVNAPEFDQELSDDDAQAVENFSESSPASGNAFESLAETDSILRDAAAKAQEQKEQAEEQGEPDSDPKHAEQALAEDEAPEASGKADVQADSADDGADDGADENASVSVLAKDTDSSDDSSEAIADNASSDDDLAAEDSTESELAEGDEIETDPRRLLHEEYLQAKKRFGEPVEDDLDFTQFNANLDALADNLKKERGGIDVRFELRIQDGTVALQPRIIREKSRPPEDSKGTSKSAS